MISRISLVLMCFTTQLNAEPIVIYDSGQTMPSFEYKQILQGVEIPDFGKNWTTEKLTKVEPLKDLNNPENWLPITSKKLSPGKVKAREVQFNQLMSPVCIIGSDAQSLRWIKKYQSILKENNVLCWLVEAKNINDVKKVVKALDGVSMSPVDGDAIAKFFSIRHYPLLITQRFIEQ